MPSIEYLKLFMFGFLPCLIIWAICENLISRREWGWWPWKIPLYRKKDFFKKMADEYAEDMQARGYCEVCGFDWDPEDPCPYH